MANLEVEKSLISFADIKEKLYQQYLTADLSNKCYNIAERTHAEIRGEISNLKDASGIYYTFGYNVPTVFEILKGKNISLA